MDSKCDIKKGCSQMLLIVMGLAFFCNLYFVIASILNFSSLLRSIASYQNADLSITTCNSLCPLPFSTQTQSQKCCDSNYSTCTSKVECLNSKVSSLQSQKITQIIILVIEAGVEAILFFIFVCYCRTKRQRDLLRLNDPQESVVQSTSYNMFRRFANRFRKEQIPNPPILESFLYQSGIEGCPICLESLNEKVIKLQCQHIFHSMCIRQWLQTRNQCPLCRKPNH